MELVLIIVAMACMFGGFFGYNSLRRKYAGIMGIPGAYLILIGLMLLVSLIGSLFMDGPEGSATLMEKVMTIIIMLLGLAYMVYVIVVKCETKAQKIMLPFAALMIGFGFVWRLLAAIVLHMPMESGKVETASFPSAMRDSGGDVWELISNNDVYAEYRCARTGERREFGIGEFSNGKPFGFS